MSYEISHQVGTRASPVSEGQKGAAMSATLLFRIASVVFVLFAFGHTVGFLSFKPPTAEGLAVQNAMSNVGFKVGLSDLSFGGFYRGFGLSCTVSMLFSAIVCWQLGALATARSREIAVIAWSLFVVQVIGVALSIKYFGRPAVILSATVAILLGWAALLLTHAA